VAFRFPADNRRSTKLYRLPDLEEVAWRFESGGGNIGAIVGFAGDEDLAYSLSTDDDLITLDLASGRTRVVDTAVAIATVGPAGTPHFIRLDGTVASIERRALRRWNTAFDTLALPTRIWGGARQRLISLFDEGSERSLRVDAEGQTSIVQSIPAGELAMARWGDIAAIAVDSGVVIVDPVDPENRRFARIPGASHVAFSPSAHRMYVVAGNRLVTLERFDLVVMDSLDLPGPVEAIRFDRLGLLLMLRPLATDSLWVVDIVRSKITGAIAAEWGVDLPLIAYDGTLLTRRNGRIWATAANAIVEPAEAEGGTDLWLAAAWDPRRPALETAAETQETDEPTPGQRLYVQVSSTHNADWAVEFAQNLRRAGVDASVLPPGPGEELYRVVLGPYPSREEAEGTAQKLGLPFWIYAADSTGAPDSTSQFQNQ
jgi:SPOR domain